MTSLRSILSPLSRISSIPLVSSITGKRAATEDKNATAEVTPDPETSHDVDQRSGDEKPMTQRVVKSSVNGETLKQARHVVLALKEAKSATSRLHRLEKLIDFVWRMPEMRGVMVEQGVVAVLLGLRERSKDRTISGCARQALAMMGYQDPCKGYGVRILSIDGGGSRGVVAVESLKAIEQATGKPIYELFDLICGSSTGAILSFLLSFRYLPLNVCNDIYRSISLETFKQNSIVGRGKLFMNYSYYDTQAWEMTLRENCGDHETMIHTARNAKTPKVVAVSSLVNRPILRPYLFRNYEYFSGTAAFYPGSYTHKLWEVLRASTAAPGYFEECVLEDNIYNDGGMLTNNPSAVALHEAKCLWGSQIPVQCLISLGTGRRPETDPETKSKSWWLKNWQERLTQLITSATDTEAVDTVLRDLLPNGVYFRFNPTLSENIALDENRVEKLDMMQRDTVAYVEANKSKLERAATQLLLPRKRHQKAIDRMLMWKAML